MCETLWVGVRCRGGWDIVGALCGSVRDVVGGCEMLWVGVRCCGLA